MLHGLVFKARKHLTLSSLLTFFAACGGAGGAAAGGGATAPGCGDPGGINDNQKGAGDQNGGVQLAFGDIAVAPSGDFIVFTQGEGLAVAFPSTGEVRELPVQRPTQLAFSKTRPVVYVGSTEDSAVHAIDVQRRTELWSAPLADNDAWSLRLAPAKDDSRLLAGSGGHVAVLDPRTGKVVAEREIAEGIADLEILPDGARALAVARHTWLPDQTPRTEITVLSLADGAARTFEVPNCSDDITVAPSGNTAFLAPTSCTKDPISLIDLTPGHEAFVKNLPGFGPLAIGPHGDTAVGFYSTAAGDAALFDDPAQMPDPASAAYHLMVIDLDTLTYSFHPWGETLPRYAVTPDGNVLLVDSRVSAPARIFDIRTSTFHTIDGPQIQLESFVITSDSSHVYALYPEDLQNDSTKDALFGIDLAAAVTTKIETGFNPLNINLSPDDKTLFLREDEHNLCVFPLKTGACSVTISTGTAVQSR